MSSPGSWKNYVSGVKVLHLLAGFPFPHLSTIEFRLVVKGASKLNPFRPRQALPLTPAILLDMRAVMDLKSPLHASMWCSFLLGFFLFARKSNLVPPSAKAFDPAKHLCRRDIRLSGEGILVHIKWSKTLQTRERLLLVPAVSLPGSPLCPQQAVLNMCHLCPARGSPPPF